jgi:diguanylate cyclase (GGDEF)-like protein
MLNLPQASLMPTKLRYKLLVSFCLASVLPLLIGVYISSLFIHFPFTGDSASLITVSVVMFFSALLSFLGYQITRQLILPITNAAATAVGIANGMGHEYEPGRGEDELEDLSRSLKTIQMNARELIEKVEKLSIKDKLTGLYNATYIRERLDEEIQRAAHFQRACSFAYFFVSDLEGYKLSHGQAAVDSALKAIADVFSKNLSEFDRAARIKGDDFVLIFPDRNKKKAIEIVEDLRRQIDQTLQSEGRNLLVSVGISENPIDGVSAQELFLKAHDRAKSAAVHSNGSIEAFA